MARSRPFFLLALAALASLPALASAQKVVAWGENYQGQVSGAAAVRDAVQLAAGALHAVALKRDGTVAAWGDNTWGQVSGAAAVRNAVQVDAGDSHCVALLSDGSLKSWGVDWGGQIRMTPTIENAVWASGAYWNSIALLTDGTVLAWGWEDQPVMSQAGSVADAVKVDAGDLHAVALKANGTVVAWGDGSEGATTVPAGLTGVVGVSAGNLFSLAVKADGTVVAWGYNVYGQATVPTGLKGAVQVSAGGGHSLALLKDGTVAAWGSNEIGQTTVPAGLTGVLQVAAGGKFSLALVAEAHCTLDQRTVYAGGAATGTVRLAHPAPTGGATVGLASSDAAVHVPATVRVPEGASTATFPVATDFSLQERDVTIRTVYGSSDNERRTVPASLKVKAAIVTASFASSTIGGSTVRPKLTVGFDYAVAADVKLGLTSGDPAVTVPPTVTVPAGQKSTTILLGTTPVAANRTVTVALENDQGETATTASLTLTPIRANVALVTPTLNGGEAGKGTVYLNAAMAGPVTVQLSSGDPSVSLPTSITVAAGARFATFPITTTPVSTNRTVPITAKITGNPFSANIRVLAIPSLRSVTLPTSVFGNGKVTGTVRLTLSGRPGGTVVQLSSSDASLSVPSTVTVPEGQYAATFEATSSDVAFGASATVTASTPLGAASAGITIKPLVLSGLTLSATAAAGGSTVTLTLTLNAAVGVDTPVTLTSADPALVPVPATATIPAGSRTATVMVTLGSTGIAKNVRITASKHASSLYRTLKVTP